MTPAKSIEKVLDNAQLVIAEYPSARSEECRKQPLSS
jgi:hypothetical protein